uniref:Si:ch211-213a13.2 n=1 Tax=Sinocyclocheilus grahami TaxID=75366 RepID=A0A672L3A3_SINGR
SYFELQLLTECWYQVRVFVNSSSTVHHFSLRDCGLTEESCSALATVLRSNSSLKDLDMSNNNLQDSGVKKLQNGLENTNCTLEKLRLNKCNLTDKSCSALAAVLGSDTNLKELNMNNNNLQDSGVKLLCSGLKSVKCELEILRLRCCDMKHKGCSALTSALKSNPSHLRELSLSENKLGDSGVKNLIIVLFLSVFSLCECSITEEQCLILTSALKSNPSHLRELDLSENKIENKGVNYLCDVLKDSLCKLERLRLNDCNLTDKSCSALATVLGSDTSLKELNLSNNNLQDSGVKLLCTGLKNIQCKLEILRLSDCSITEEGYKALASALRSNPSHLIELDLRGNDPGQSGVKELLDVQQDPNCQLILRLNNCELTEKSCSVLATVLSSKTILKEINLNNSHLLDSGVKEICEGLKNPVCELKILK